MTREVRVLLVHPLCGAELVMHHVACSLVAVSAVSSRPIVVQARSVHKRGVPRRSDRYSKPPEYIVPRSAFSASKYGISLGQHKRVLHDLGQGRAIHEKKGACHERERAVYGTGHVCGVVFVTAHVGATDWHDFARSSPCKVRPKKVGRVRMGRPVVNLGISKDETGTLREKMTHCTDGVVEHREMERGVFLCMTNKGGIHGRPMQGPLKPKPCAEQGSGRTIVHSVRVDEKSVSDLLRRFMQTTDDISDIDGLRVWNRRDGWCRFLAYDPEQEVAHLARGGPMICQI